ncbi:mitochondrial distribution and morphology protein 31 [Monosporozyma unispora]|nr:Mitochondrial distribution and morphology protein 31, mitochondrial precursor [Kazachstania unispora]
MANRQIRQQRDGMWKRVVGLNVRKVAFTSRTVKLPLSYRFYSTQGFKFKRRPWFKRVSPDNVSAVVSWVLWSHAVWIALSTTTFASGLLYLVSSTESGQNWTTKKLSNYLTQSTGVQILFEQAKLKHNWTHGTIQCHNLYLSRRPVLEDSPKDHDRERNDIIQRVKWALNDNVLVQMDHFQDGDYTQFDLAIESCEVSLSFWKWLNGKGIIEDLTLSGMRGVIDRTHLKPVDPNAPVQPRYVRRPGDFEIDKFKVNDALVTLYQPNGFRPFQISIFHGQLPQLRKQWLLYDMLNGDSVTGTFDDSMFILQRQHSTSHFRVDKLNIDHLNGGTQGPFGWITRGFVDIETNMTFPRLESTTRDVKFDINLQLKDVKAEIPFFKNEFMTYKNKALVKPIVGYINSHKTYIPIECSLEKPMLDFNGAWTVYDSNLIQDVSWKCWDAFALYVTDEQRKTLRIKKVTFWSVQLFLQVVLMALGSIAS